MLRPILFALSSACTIAGWARAYRQAYARAKAAEERAWKAEQESERLLRISNDMRDWAFHLLACLDGARHGCEIMSRARDAAIDERDAALLEQQAATHRADCTYKGMISAMDERDAARSAHASALRDIAEARRMANMPATSSPQDIVRALLARQN